MRLRKLSLLVGGTMLFCLPIAAGATPVASHSDPSTRAWLRQGNFQATQPNTAGENEDIYATIAILKTREPISGATSWHSLGTAIGAENEPALELPGTPFPGRISGIVLTPVSTNWRIGSGARMIDTDWGRLLAQFGDVAGWNLWQSFEAILSGSALADAAARRQRVTRSRGTRNRAQRAGQWGPDSFGTLVLYGAVVLGVGALVGLIFLYRRHVSAARPQP